MLLENCNDGVDLRAFAGRFPTGVAVITTRDRQGRCFGVTANAIASISLEPPLFLISLSRRSSTLAAIIDSGRFCINLLSNRQKDLSRLFASKQRDKFHSVEYAIGACGSPLIAGALAHGECQLETTYEGGDHTIILGRVARTILYDADPLVYHRGGFAALAERPPPN